ncbi:MAG: winged helix-turn-helix domain-containing protein [Candidatus Angelobacter sp.]
MKNKFSPQSREAVLETIKARPNISAKQIAEAVGLSYRSVAMIVAVLADEGVVGWVDLLPSREARQGHCRGYYVGSMGIPAAWDVLAHFFGRIAEPAAA